MGNIPERGNHHLFFNRYAVKYINVIVYRRGSVVAYFTIKYNAINRDQVTTFNADLKVLQKMDNMSIAEDFTIKISEGNIVYFL